MKVRRKITISIMALLINFNLHSLIYAQQLFNESNYLSLTEDHKAHSVGDVLTVLVLQDSEASSKAGLSTGKNFSVNATGNLDDTSHKFGVGLGAADTGTGQTSRGGNIKAVLTVKITAINNPNRYEIEGLQHITINGENQNINLKGTIRPDDIASDNTILSTQIANAEISYTGDGALSSAQRHGIIYRFLSFLGIV